MVNEIQDTNASKLFFIQSKVKVNGSLNFPTVEECALFSLDAYNTTNNSNMPPGWQCIEIKPAPNSADYYGKCYIKNWNTDASMIVFAHRGTDFTSSANIFGDFQIALEKSPAQFDEAWNFVWRCLKYLKLVGPSSQDDPDQYYYPYTFTVTNAGHSLGGAIAQAITSMGGGQNPLLYSVTFENPGARGPIKDFMKKMTFEYYIAEALAWMDENVLVFQRGVNLINACNEQVGKCFRIAKIPINYSTTLDILPYPPSSKFSSNPFYIVNNTSDQHRMAPIVDLIKGSGFKYYAIKNPFSFQGGYIEYLNPENGDYWKGYFDSIWKNSAVMRWKYNDNVNDFYFDSALKLKAMYEMAQKFFIADDKISISQLGMFQPKTTEEIIQEFLLMEKDKTEEEKFGYCKIM